METRGNKDISCMVCGSGMKPYFTKVFDSFGLDRVDYVECPDCGFVASKTHFQMSQPEWEKLNVAYHKSFQGMDSCADDKNWITRLQMQARVIADVKKLGLLPHERSWVDYGCGDGKLSDNLKKLGETGLQKYDRYMTSPEHLPAAKILPGSFDFVIHTSVLEHLRDRATMDGIAALVSENGVFGVHTLVMERIPADPAWFYLLPVHCAFYSNESMRRLFNFWGYTSSIYHVEARLWLFFKGDPGVVEAAIAKANARQGMEEYFYHFKRGFMDYWK